MDTKTRELIALQALSIIILDESRCMCSALKGAAYRYGENITYAEVRQIFGLNKYKPKDRTPTQFWFDFDEAGQSKRIEILTTIITQLNDETAN